MKVLLSPSVVTLTLVTAILLVSSRADTLLAGQSSETKNRITNGAHDAEQLTRLKQDLWPEAYREHEVELLDSILDDSFILVDAQGNWTNKQQELAFLPDYNWPHSRFEYRIKRLELISDDAAIVAGEGMAQGTEESGPYCLRYQSSNVLVRRSQGWKAVLSHVSGVETRCDSKN